ncbi:hypothetical protein [Barnesiella sp. CU968]|uniref:hypothetical protein n=1 Tax=Barnesiella sp. CU968 TaxID=2780099 RepID=UPI001EF9FEE7|nr:hypothetical protein [Barnesiella sp. CU968]
MKSRKKLVLSIGENTTPVEVVPSALMITLELFSDIEPPGDSGFLGSSDEHEFKDINSSDARILITFFITIQFISVILLQQAVLFF